MHGIEDIYPLSPLQHAMLLHSLVDSSTGVYVDQLACELRGALDVERFQEAWNEVLRRHASLRAGLVWRGLKQPMQIIHRDVKVAMRREDWRAVPQREIVARLRSFREADRRCAFDATVPPLLRLALFRTDDAVHQFIWTFHHMLLDGWSRPVLLEEVLALYGRQPADPPLPSAPPFKEYIAWVKAQDVPAAEAFWRSYLDGVIAPSRLGIDRRPERSAAPAARLHTSERRVNAATKSAVESFARAHRLTLATLAQGAWAVLIGRYGGGEDVVFGLTVAGRPLSVRGVERMLGMFINTLPLRVRLRPDAAIGRWLAELQRSCGAIQDRGYLPLPQIQGCSAVPRGLPLFESVLVVENYPLDPALGQRIAGVEVGELAVSEAPGGPFIIAVVPGAEMLLRVHYDPDRFQASAIDALLGHFETVLEGMAGSPNRCLGELSLFTEEDRDSLVLGARTPEVQASFVPVQRLIEAQAAKTPDRRAVVAGDRVLSYGELNSLANRIARHLRARGAAPGVAVGLCFERSWEMVAALLGIIKAGAGYVPLDPGYPKQRLTAMLETAGVAVLLTVGGLREQLPAAGSEVVCLDREWAAIMARSAENLAGEEQPEDLAYIIYTSGSTGRPKRSAVHRGGLCNLLRWFVDEFEVSATDRVLVVTSLSFDLTQKNIFAPLAVGGELHLAPSGPYDPQRIAALIASGEISLLNTTPSGFYPLLSRAPSLQSVRTVFLGGEPIVGAQLRSFVEHGAGRIEIVNTYGPTECSDIAAYHRLRFPEDFGVTAIPIGRPITGVRLCVVDEGLELVPAGITGELCIGGVGVGLGYLNDPGLTAAKFVPNAFGRRAGERLYRTGDLVRLRADGCIEFVGRVDHQVKLRGFRVELEEIDAMLNRQPGVRQGVVVARADQSGEQRLVAYVQPEAGRQGTVDGTLAAALRAALRELLPEYMVPTAFMFFDALPMSPNGKVDRKALPEPDLALTTHAVAFAEPRTTTQTALAAIWAEVLEIGRVGLHDDFFALGGHSLLLTRVLSRIQRELGVDVPVRAVFERPTLEALAAGVDALRGGERSAPIPIPRLQRVPRRREDLWTESQTTGAEGSGVFLFSMSAAQRRLWLVEQLAPGSGAYHIAAAVRLRGRVDERALRRSFEVVVRRHEALRTTFEVVEGEPRQVVWGELAVGLAVVDLGGLPAGRREAEVLRLVREESRAGFDLGGGPLLRVGLLRVGGEEAVLLLTLHHIVSDGWSMGVLVRELGVLYGAYVRGEEAELAELPIQYADYALWQEEQLRGEGMAGAIGYWKGRLGGEVPLLELPTDRPRPAVQSFAGEVYGFAVSGELLGRLREVGRGAGASLFMVLLAGFQGLLVRYGGQAEQWVGVPVAGRTRVETEGLIGFFVNMLVLRTDLSGDPSFAEAVGRVREVALEAYAHQEVPFERLVEELQPERDASRSPLFQVAFALQNTAPEQLEIPGVEVTPVDVPSRTAKFELALLMSEHRGGLSGTLEYSTALFDAATIARMAGHYVRLLESAVAQPQARLSMLDLLTEGELRQQLSDWNATRQPYPADRCLHELFEARAPAEPQQRAVSCAERSLTCAELNARANQLGHRLRRLGVGPEVPVAVLLERSITMVIAFLAVLKAGGTYVPFEPGTPPERLAFMLKDTNPCVILTERGVAAASPEARWQRLLLDAEETALAGECTTNLSVAVTPDHLAYVMYTSGSTGQPKGVAIPHRAVNRLVFDREYVSLSPADRIAQLSNTAFDAATFEIWTALLLGCELHILPKDLVLSAEAFAAEVQRSGITTVFLTTALFNQLAREAREVFSGLRTVLFGGEAVDPRWVETVLGEMGSGRLVHVYGPTENTTFSSWYHVTSVAKGARTVPIGGPIANSELYVLDHQMRPVPVGAPGEVYLGGAGLARGYLARPALTAASFLPHPFSAVLGARLYRTGDLARFRADGNVEFLGRADHQVKVRGHRIELGEIETVLARHPDVAQAIVVCREDQPGDKRLFAYLVARTFRQIAAADLRAYLRSSVPEYMIPASFVWIDAIKLGATGKIDRRSLPAPAERTEPSRGFVAPSTPAERLIAAIWAEVLGVERVDLEDNFFDLGGNSLLAISVHKRVRAALQCEFSVVELFKYPTVAALAGFLSRYGSAAHGESDISTRAVRQREALTHRKQFAKTRRKL